MTFVGCVVYKHTSGHTARRSINVIFFVGLVRNNVCIVLDVCKEMANFANKRVLLPVNHAGEITRCENLLTYINSFAVLRV